MVWQFLSQVTEILLHGIEEMIPADGVGPLAPEPVQFQQVKTVKGRLGVSGQTDQHLHVGRVQCGHQEIPSQSDELVQAHLKCAM